MKKKCFKITLKYLENTLSKVTSYEVVKSRLNYRLYSSDLLNDREEYFKQKKETQ